MTISLAFMLTACNHQHEGVQEAVHKQLEIYPESTLQDIYKSFFQDEFGPGHLLGDTSSARRYLEYELANMDSKGNYRIEPCGEGRQFYRVPLDLVKDGKISFEDYLEAFLASAASFKSPEVTAWSKKCERIVLEIEQMDLSIEGFEDDKAKLNQLLENGDFVVHHSALYAKLYEPHYRIMLSDRAKAWGKPD